MSQCRFCFGPIKFVLLDTGKPIPVDPIARHDRGNVAAKVEGGRLVGYVISQAKPLRGGYLRYLPHHGSCKPEKPRVNAANRMPSLFDPGAAMAANP